MNQIKKAVAFSMSMVLFGTAAFPNIPSSIAKSTTSVEKVSIVSSLTGSVYMKKGESLKLKTIVLPVTAKNKKVKFKSSNKKVVMVSASGKIKAKKKGTVKITAMAKDGSKKKAVVKIKVLKNFKKVKTIALNKKTVSLSENETASLTAIVKPVNATKRKVVYKSSDKKVASVSSKGLIHAAAAGTAKITAYATDGRGAKAMCKVIVSPKSVDAVVSPANPTIAPTQNPVVSPTPTIAPTTEPTMNPADVKEKSVFSSDNNYRSYAVLKYDLPDGVKTKDITGITFGVDTDKKLSLRLYAGMKRIASQELTAGGTRKVKDTVTGTSTITIEGANVTKTAHTLELQTEHTTRPSISKGEYRKVSLALDEGARTQLVNASESQLQLCLYPHAVAPRIAFYNMMIHTETKEYTVSLDEETVTAADGGALKFLK